MNENTIESINTINKSRKSMNQDGAWIRNPFECDNKTSNMDC